MKNIMKVFIFSIILIGCSNDYKNIDKDTCIYRVNVSPAFSFDLLSKEITKDQFLKIKNMSEQSTHRVLISLKTSSKIDREKDAKLIAGKEHEVTGTSYFYIEVHKANTLFNKCTNSVINNMGITGALSAIYSDPTSNLVYSVNIVYLSDSSCIKKYDDPNSEEYIDKYNKYMELIK